MDWSRIREAMRGGCVDPFVAARYYGGGKDSDAPDYTPMAQASKEAAEIGAALGREQLAEGKRQHEETMKIAQPVVDAQLRLMQQGINQGNDYYQYSKEYRPLERAMLAEVSGLTQADMKSISDMRAAERMVAQANWNAQRDGKVSELQRQYEDAIAAEQQAAQASNANMGGMIPLKMPDGKVQFIDQSALKTGVFKYDPIAASMYMNGPADNEAHWLYTAENRDKLDKVAGVKNMMDAALSEGIIQKDKTGRSTSFGVAGNQQQVNQIAEQLRQKGWEYYDGVGWAKKAGNTIATGSGGSNDNSRSAQILEQLNKLKGEQFDPNSVNTPLSELEQLSKTMAGREALAARDKAERDWILSPQQIAQQEIQDQKDRDTLMLGRGELYLKDKANIDDMIGTAVADSRAGYTQALGQIARQGLRYGLSPAALASQAGSLGLGQASQQASAANAARNAGVDDYRARVGMNRDMRQGDFAKNTGLKQSTRDMRVQDESLRWARSLDVTGMARGMPGASQGAYGVATQAGNSAVANRNMVGNSYMNAIAQGTGTIMQGQGQRIQGLGSILNSQTQLAGQGGGDSFGSILGGIGGVAAGLGKMGVTFS